MSYRSLGWVIYRITMTGYNHRCGARGRCGVVGFCSGDRAPHPDHMPHPAMYHWLTTEVTCRSGMVLLGYHVEMCHVVKCIDHMDTWHTVHHFETEINVGII